MGIAFMWQPESKRLQSLQRLQGGISLNNEKHKAITRQWVWILGTGLHEALLTWGADAGVEANGIGM